MQKPYDREELYRQVWEKPLMKVAEEYGVSAVALGKTCRKLSVPVPGRGYWAKLAHGHAAMKKPPLPKLDNVPIITILQWNGGRASPTRMIPNSPRSANCSLLAPSIPHRSMPPLDRLR